MEYVIVFAVIAFLIALSIIYFKEIKSIIGSKFKIKKNSKKGETNSKTEQKKEEKKKNSYTVEDFVPINREKVDDVRDPSLDELFATDDVEFSDDFSIENNLNFKDEIKDLFKDETQKSKKTKIDSFDINNNSFAPIFDSKINKNDKSIADKIKELPPEIKVLLMDNVLKKRDDV